MDTITNSNQPPSEIKLVNVTTGSTSNNCIFNNVALPAHIVKTTPVNKKINWEQRQNHLLAIKNKLIAPTIIISGASASGKSYVTNLLNELGNIVATRLITRPIRADDLASDRSWNTKATEQHSVNLIFAYGKFGQNYGFLRSDWQKAILQKKSLVAVIGDIGKVIPIVRNLDQDYPLLPITVIRLEVPDEVIERRLSGRAQAFKGEANTRALINALLEQWEIQQFSILKKTFGLKKIANLSESDDALLKPEHKNVKPINKILIKELTDTFNAQAKQTSASLAEDVLNVRIINTNTPGISKDLLFVLDQKFATHFADTIDKPVLKGGLAVAAYLHGTTPGCIDTSGSLLKSWQLNSNFIRHVSPDIDWTATAADFSYYLQTVESISGQALSLKSFQEKPIYKSVKATSCLTTDSGETIELDSIQTTNIQPNNSKFTFTMNYDQHVDFFHREVLLPSGNSLYLAPPEFLIIEKLLAGRGAQLNKQDLADAITLAATQKIDVNLILYILEKQDFNTALDSDLGDLSQKPQLSNMTNSLRHIGIQNENLLNTLTERFLACSETSTTKRSTIPLEWSTTNLKKIAMLDRLLVNLENAATQDQLSQALPAEAIQDTIQTWRDLLLHYATYQLGRTDIFFHESIHSLVQSEQCENQ